jgi:hypothetical protein
MTGASLKPPVDSQQSAMNGNTNDAALDGDDVKLHDSFAQGFRVGAEPATLQERRVSWGNLLWSDFTAQQPYVASIPFTKSEGRQRERATSASAFEPIPDWPFLPRARGKLSEFVLGAFRAVSSPLGPAPSVDVDDALDDSDFQLALFLCYELHYRSISNLELEWDPTLLGLRLELEDTFVRRLRQNSEPGEVNPGDVVALLDQVVRTRNVENIAEYLDQRGSLDQLREYCVLRSPSLLRSGDASALGVARLRGRAKAAMARIQFGDLGYGDAAAMISSQFSATMTSLQLEPNYGAYTDNLPAVSLAAANLESLFGLHQRWRAALVGQLTASKMTSVDAMSHCSRAMQRLEGSVAGAQYFDVRMNADAIHAFIARNQLVTGLLETDPTSSDDVVFGAQAYLTLEDNLARHVLGSWSEKCSSLFRWDVPSHADAPVANEDAPQDPHVGIETREQLDSP